MGIAKHYLGSWVIISFTSIRIEWSYIYILNLLYNTYHVSYHRKYGFPRYRSHRYWPNSCDRSSLQLQERKPPVVPKFHHANADKGNDCPRSEEHTSELQSP